MTQAEIKVWDAKKVREEFQHMWNDWFGVASAAGEYFDLVEKTPGYFTYYGTTFGDQLGLVMRGLEERRITPPEDRFVRGSIELAEEKDRSRAAHLNDLAKTGNSTLEEITDMTKRYERKMVRNGSKQSSSLIVPEQDRPVIHEKIEKLREICAEANMILYAKTEVPFFKPWRPSDEMVGRAKLLLTLTPKQNT